MEKRKLLKSKQINSTTPLFWMLPKTKAPAEQSYKHEKAIGDLYVALSFLDWSEGQEFDGIKPDAITHYNGVRILFEVDRGNEFQKLHMKLDSYIRFLKRAENTYAVFSLLDGKRTLHNTGNDILHYIKDRGVFHQLLITPHDLFISDPMAEVLVAPTQAKSLKQLT